MSISVVMTFWKGMEKFLLYMALERVIKIYLVPHFQKHDYIMANILQILIY